MWADVWTRINIKLFVNTWIPKCDDSNSLPGYNGLTKKQDLLRNDNSLCSRVDGRWWKLEYFIARQAAIMKQNILVLFVSCFLESILASQFRITSISPQQNPIEVEEGGEVTLTCKANRYIRYAFLDIMFTSVVSAKLLYAYHPCRGCTWRHKDKSCKLEFSYTAKRLIKRWVGVSVKWIRLKVINLYTSRCLVYDNQVQTTGDYESHECSIRIHPVLEYDNGLWACEVREYVTRFALSLPLSMDRRRYSSTSSQVEHISAAKRRDQIFEHFSLSKRGEINILWRSKRFLSFKIFVDHRSNENSGNNRHSFRNFPKWDRFSSHHNRGEGDVCGTHCYLEPLLSVRHYNFVGVRSDVDQEETKPRSEFRPFALTWSHPNHVS